MGCGAQPRLDPRWMDAGALAADQPERRAPGSAILGGGIHCGISLPRDEMAEPYVEGGTGMLDDRAMNA